jgi:hypothetical protein
MTDSFANACFCNLAADHPGDIATRFEFRGCTPLVREIVAAAIDRGLSEAGKISR